MSNQSTVNFHLEKAGEKKRNREFYSVGEIQLKLYWTPSFTNGRNWNKFEVGTYMYIVHVSFTILHVIGSIYMYTVYNKGVKLMVYGSLVQHVHVYVHVHVHVHVAL